MRYKTRGAGGGATIISPTYSDVTATADPNSYLNGSVTMDGDVWEVPVTSSANHQGFNPALKFSLPMPNVMNGTNTKIGFLVEFETAPTGHWSLQIGIFQTSWVGCGGGLEHHSAGDGRACCSVFGAVDVGNKYASLQAEGCIFLPGTWNGSNNVAGTANSSLIFADDGSAANRKTGASTTYDRDLSDFVIAINHRNTSSATETLRFRVNYWEMAPATF